MSLMHENMPGDFKCSCALVSARSLGRSASPGSRFLYPGLSLNNVGRNHGIHQGRADQPGEPPVQSAVISSASPEPPPLPEPGADPALPAPAQPAPSDDDAAKKAFLLGSLIGAASASSANARDQTHTARTQSQTLEL